MANSTTDSDGFITVSKKKSTKGKKVQNYLKQHAAKETKEDVNVEFCLKSISIAKTEVEISDFFQSLKLLLRVALKNDQDHKDIKNIVCWGLGSFTSCKIALHQLALLLLLSEHLNCPAEVFDPIFSQADKQILSQLKLCTSEENCEGKRKSGPVGATLFILPHCPRELSNNLLYANWKPSLLENCIVFANSLESLRLNTPERFLSNYHYLLQAQEVVEELQVPNTYRFPDVFNDLSLHIFPTRLLQKVQPEFWDASESPIYPESTWSELVSRSDRQDGS
nr:EOG090X0FII [Eurycercus lamellatus]